MLALSNMKEEDAEVRSAQGGANANTALIRLTVDASASKSSNNKREKQTSKHAPQPRDANMVMVVQQGD